MEIGELESDDLNEIITKSRVLEKDLENIADSTVKFLHLQCS